jgi:hypothetical protein
MTALKSEPWKKLTPKAAKKGGMTARPIQHHCKVYLRSREG